jgi:4-hydroxy-2-oxoglutarate aldolase
MKQLSGVMVPVVSAFDAAGELARAPYERNARAHLAAGMSGLVVTGSSGEAALLDEDERVRLVEWARPLVAADRWLIAGVGGESTRQTVRRARSAAAAGADAVLVVAPHYYMRRMSEAALRAHFTRVADESPVPVLLYNVPAYAHLVLSAELVAALAGHANVIGMKDSAGDLPMLERYLAAASPAFRVLTGSGQSAQQAFAMGASGAVLAAALFAGALTLGIYDAARAGDVVSAVALQARLTPLAREIVAGLGPAGLKAAMDLVGLEGGAPRAPLLALDDAERARVAAVLAEAGLLEPATATPATAGSRG